MKKFEELDQSLQNQIIDICKDDPYNLNPEFLYMCKKRKHLNTVSENT